MADRQTSPRTQQAQFFATMMAMMAASGMPSGQGQASGSQGPDSTSSPAPKAMSAPGGNGGGSGSQQQSYVHSPHSSAPPVLSLVQLRGCQQQRYMQPWPTVPGNTILSAGDKAKKEWTFNKALQEDPNYAKFLLDRVSTLKNSNLRLYARYLLERYVKAGPNSIDDGVVLQVTNPTTRSEPMQLPMHPTAGMATTMPTMTGHGPMPAAEMTWQEPVQQPTEEMVTTEQAQWMMQMVAMQQQAIQQLTEQQAIQQQEAAQRGTRRMAEGPLDGIDPMEGVEKPEAE